MVEQGLAAGHGVLAVAPGVDQEQARRGRVVGGEAQHGVDRGADALRPGAGCGTGIGDRRAQACRGGVEGLTEVLGRLEKIPHTSLRDRGRKFSPYRYEHVLSLEEANHAGPLEGPSDSDDNAREGHRAFARPFGEAEADGRRAPGVVSRGARLQIAINGVRVPDEFDRLTR